MLAAKWAFSAATTQQPKPFQSLPRSERGREHSHFFLPPKWLRAGRKQLRAERGAPCPATASTLPLNSPRLFRASFFSPRKPSFSNGRMAYSCGSIRHDSAHRAEERRVHKALAAYSVTNKCLQLNALNTPHCPVLLFNSWCLYDIFYCFLPFFQILKSYN